MDNISQRHHGTRDATVVLDTAVAATMARAFDITSILTSEGCTTDLGISVKERAKMSLVYPHDAGVRTRVAQWCSVITLKIPVAGAYAWVSIGSGGITPIAILAMLAAAISLGLEKRAACGREATS